MSNKDRISRAADEARASAAEKVAKKAVKEPAAAKAKRAPKAPARVKLVWEVCTPTGKVVKTYAYPEKALAEAEIVRLAKNSGTHLLHSNKVPME